MTRRAIVQIGTEKTGTTSLQMFLSANRDRLAERGFVYPRFCGDINQTGLAAYAMAPEVMDPLRTTHGISHPSDVASARARMEAAADLELRGTGTAIFCNEHCHSRLKTEDEIATLRDFLARHYDDIQISVYLRRQDQVAVSLYSTRLKSGGTDTSILPVTHAQDLYFNYDRSLARWERCFGRENIHVRIFDREVLLGGSVITDFLSAWSLGEAEDFHAVGDQNESISPAAQAYLRALNKHLVPVEGLTMEAVLGPLSNRLARQYPGSGARPARVAARRFYEMYAASNEAVRRRYFPERPSLFNEDFSTYPEVEATPELTVDTLAQIAASLHLDTVRDLRRLEAEVGIRDARLAWSRGDKAAAYAALRAAYRWMPRHGPSYRALGECLLQDGRVEEAVEAARRAAYLSPEQVDHWHFLGVVLRRTGDLVGAEDAQIRALVIDPAHEGARASLEQIRQARAGQTTATENA
jgi:tetratricopeptide (TPR) repeat protein